jgi:hypothetical protein
MKYAGIMISIFLIQCSSPKEVTHEFPSAMEASVKTEYIKLFDKGQVLYNLNCGGCHTQIVKGKKIVPDFTPDQLKGYELRITNAQHEKNLTDDSITEEELGMIMTFLSYKKKTPK